MTSPSSPLTAEPVGMIALLKERATNERQLNEFREPLVSVRVTESVLPAFDYDEGLKIAVELRIGAFYTVFRGDKDAAVMIHKRNAYRAMADLLYRDVLTDLRRIIAAAGDGRRGETLNLLGELHDRLRS